MLERLEALEIKYHQRLGAKESLEGRKGQVYREIETLRGEVALTEKAIYLLQKYAEDQQEILASRIEGVVTAGIQAVFQDPNLVFKLNYGEKKDGGVKKAPEVTMSVYYKYDGEVVKGSLKDSFGGGLAVVTSTLLNILIVMQLAPRVSPIVLWDEPLSDLSPEYDNQPSVVNGYRERMADFLRKLTEDTDMQIILVSHEPEFGKVADFHHRFSGGVGRTPEVKTSRYEKVVELEEVDE